MVSKPLQASRVERGTDENLTGYQLDVRGVERFHYWRLFFWTLFRRPRLFPLAITLAIMGFHFRQVAELHVG